MRKVKIGGTGIYMPHRKVTASELAERLGISEDQLLQKTGVRCRHFADQKETASVMGAQAAKAAIAKAGLQLSDIDLIVCASRSMQQPIPCTGTLIHKELGMEEKTIPSFDINSTCLSFVVALDLISYLIDAGRYRHVVIVSSEIASVGLNFADPETAGLFGDGAAAVVVSKATDGENSHIIHGDMQTHTQGKDFCAIVGGGSAYPPQHWTKETAHLFQFKMNGKAVFRLASKELPSFVAGLLQKSHLSMDEIDVVIPHQASKSALRIIEKKLGIEGKMVDVIENSGNMIAASIPFALHMAIEEGKLQRGERVLLLGTSAGLSIGGLVLRY